LLILFNYHVSGKFPETAWRATRSHQATHTILGYFWVPEEEPPVGKISTARRRVADSLSFWVFVELPSGDEHLPGDASCFGLIFVFCLFWEDSDQG